MTHTGTNHTKKRLPLTPAQAKLVEAIHSLRQRNGVAPSYEELMAELGISKTVVAERVRKLCSRDLLGKKPGRYRNLLILRAGHKALADYKSAA